MSQKDVEMAKYILSILKSSGSIMQSWGACKFLIIENGLEFSVNGFKHKGLVHVIYREGKDLFEVQLLTKRSKLLSVSTDVYIDELVSRIDNLVELTENYEESVQKWLPKALRKL